MNDAIAQQILNELILIRQTLERAYPEKANRPVPPAPPSPQYVTGTDRLPEHF